MITLSILFLALGLLSNFVKADSNPIVDLNYTRYRGTSLPNGINQWLGMRYAAPPLGNLRFRKPQDPLINDTLQIADQFGPQCLSTTVLTLVNTTSEDCLFVDVMAPASAELLPVYVFFQGGGFNKLGNAQWNATGLIEASDMNIVVVTFSYRVGPYGFLTSKEIVADGDLNVGLLDQRKVLEWVQSHISKFGGNPNHVTIGGDSAGGASVDLHLTAYGGRDDGLFHAAVAEAQSFGAQLTVAESQYQYDSLVERVGCSNATNTLKCLRSVDVALLQSKNIYVPTPGGAGGNPVFMYSNVIDGNFTPDYTYNMFATGQFLRVPVIFGDTTNEGTIFAPKNISSVSEMNDFLRNNFVRLTDSQLAKINQFYPKAEQFPDSGPYWRAAANAYGEMRYNCPGIAISTAYDDAGVEESWLYHYNVIDPADNASGDGVSHTIEVVAVWGTEYIAKSTPPASYYTTNKFITPVLQGYWTSFIRSKNPNTYRLNGTAEWKRFSREEKARILFQTNATRMEVVPDDQKARCQYVSGIGASIAQ
ncbi:carboxylic ester hydrolase-11 [Coleophoma cylindrospora]|uniref:Carboxylic ester hydrolase n=1 Tax=Coleophoma cylindrospora TaxID=1849047 RepID=A0A3D8Q8S4_9HELO|nr:carboxylic ester hydrolase-11 [Coleophoma cylindrospora]